MGQPLLYDYCGFVYSYISLAMSVRVGIKITQKQFTECMLHRTQQWLQQTSNHSGSLESTGNMHPEKSQMSMLPCISYIPVWVKVYLNIRGV